MSLPMLRVAIVDTGVDPTHPDIAPVTRGARFLVDAAGRVSSDERWIDEAGHGTACAGIVSRGLRGRIELLAARVVHGEGGSDPRALIEAIRWAIERGARVVNLSLGAESWGESLLGPMEAVCRDAVQRGVVLVAAAGPEGTRPLPAVLAEVIAVGAACCPSDVLYAADEGYLQFLARGDLQRVAWLGGGSTLAQGASLAAAHLSRAACALLLSEPRLDVEGVRRALGARCVQGDEGFRRRWEERFDAFYRRRSPLHVDFIRRAALYPFNKENHALVRFRDLAPFMLSAVADPLGGRRAGRDAGEVIGEEPAGLIIRPDLDGALEHADTLILGHTEAAQAARGPAELPRLVRRAVERGKNVFSFSRVDPGEHAELFQLAAQKGVTIADPTVSRREVTELLRAASENPADQAQASGRRFADGRLRRQAGAFVRNVAPVLRHDCPVLGIFGTSRAQGKFSVQLALRRAFGAMGYRVSHFSTEPTGALLGAAATLPTGYEAGEGLGVEATSAIVRLLLTAIKNRERPDLLIVGGQSAVVSFDRELDRLGLGSNGALSFGAAAQPDACLLVCNVFDPPRHVKRCVAALESVLDCPVLALALNDQVWEEHLFRGSRRSRLIRLPASELAERARARSAELGLPCHAALGAEGIEALARIAADFFASAGPDAVENSEERRLG